MSAQFLNTSHLESAELAVVSYCEKQQLDLTFEKTELGYVMHSPQKGEKPIVLTLDEDLNRHERYFKQNSVYKENLARALGLKPNYRPHVVDLTAGLLGDSLLMLSFGLKVTALERNPIVSLLLESSLKTASHPLLKNLTFKQMSALEYFEINESDEADVFYFDPMFEDANDKSAPRKEMRIFREVIGQDKDAQDVIQKVIQKKYKRLVIKRPKHSQELVLKPNLEFMGKSTRYDVYLGQNQLKY